MRSSDWSSDVCSSDLSSDHGASWPGWGGDESTEHDSLTLDEIESAIAGGLEASGVEKLDLLGFDACLMATYEVASVLAPHADRMLASQELEPGHGWNYASLQVIADDPSIGVDALGSELDRKSTRLNSSP